MLIARFISGNTLTLPAYSSEFRQVTTKDLKLNCLVPLFGDAPYVGLKGEATIRTNNIRRVAWVFGRNIAKVEMLFTLPLLAAAMGCLHGAGRSLPPDFSQTPDADEDSDEGLKYGTWVLQQCSHATALGVDALLASMVLGVWTAIETMAGDLWIATINANPRLLARLAGSAKRIHQQAKAAVNEGVIGTSKQETDMLIPIKKIHDVTNGKYDMSAKMGDLLQSKVSFVRLWDIRRAYSLAFDEEKIEASVVGAVDSALADESLDALAAVRNLIVHKAGLADREYVKRSRVVGKAGFAIPQLDEGQWLNLDGEIVKSLIVPAVDRSLALLTAIDVWLDKCLSPPGYEAGSGI